MPVHPPTLRHIDTNGLRLAYLEAGEGPLVLLLHGFPDDAWTWSAQIPVLTDAGYRVVAPFLRGYPPSQVPPAGHCNSKQNASDLTELLRALADQPAFVVGHDWGGLATYGTIASAPELIERAAVVAVSHPATLIPLLDKPNLVHHLFHVWFFQVEGLSEGALRANDFGLLDYLWEMWTRSGHDDAEHLSRLKRDVFDQPGVVDALVGYYRALVRLPQNEPAFVEALLRPTTTPMLSIWGGDDPAKEAAASERELFRGGYRQEVVADAGHFVHREQPAAFNELVLSWLAGSMEADTMLEASHNS